MSQLNDFDARTVQPSQGFDKHPPGMFDFQITHTYLKDIASGQGAMLRVEFTTPAGKIEKGYNVVNPNAQAVEIAQKELSALCHAINIFQVAYPKKPDGSPIYEQAGHTLRGGRGRIEVVPQVDREGKPTNYMDVKKVFDMQGNEPGKVPAQSTPMVQGVNGGWSQPQAQPQQQQPAQQPMQQPQQPQQNTGWGNPQQPASQPQQQQPQNPGSAAPPWSR